MRTLNYIIVTFVAIVATTLVVSFSKVGTGSEGMGVFVNLLFIFGAIIAGIGGFICAGFSKPRFREWYGHSTKNPDRQDEIFLEYRKAQWRQGTLILTFGLTLICLSIAIGLFL